MAGRSRSEDRIWACNQLAISKSSCLTANSRFHLRLSGSGASPRIPALPSSQPGDAEADEPVEGSAPTSGMLGRAAQDTRNVKRPRPPAALPVTPQGQSIRARLARRPAAPPTAAPTAANPTAAAAAAAEGPAEGIAGAGRASDVAGKMAGAVDQHRTTGIAGGPVHATILAAPSGRNKSRCRRDNAGRRPA
mmetsp:Transcript_129718/g.416116  ORF Transcript_129718/g.416116 Transcript_129718/m.416116 type:complete len:192 (+) Transcript_129718:1223-1798(+)